MFSKSFTTNILMSENWRWCIQMLCKFFTKFTYWLSYILLITVNPSTTVAVNKTVLIGHATFILWWHQDVLECLSSLEMYSYTMLSTYILYTVKYALYIWSHNVAFLGKVFGCRGLFLVVSSLFFLLVLEDLLDSPFGIFALAKYFLQML